MLFLLKFVLVCRCCKTTTTNECGYMFVFINSSVFNYSPNKISYTISQIFIRKQFFNKVSSKIFFKNINKLLGLK